MAFNAINGSLTIPRANVFRDLGAPTYYTLITEYDLFLIFTPGWLNSYNPEVSNFIRDGDFVRVCYSITDRWHTGQIECMASYNPSTAQYSLVPVSLEGFKSTGKILSSETYNITTSVSFPAKGNTYMGLLPVNNNSTVASETAWNANTTYTVSIKDATSGSLIWEFYLNGNNMRYMAFGSFSTAGSSSITVEMSPAAPSGTSLDVYVFTTG